MNAFYHDIQQQPEALRRVAQFYRDNESLVALSPAVTPMLTGMGASFHAAWIASLHLHTLGISSLALEATDLLNYSSELLAHCNPLVFVSQSGASGEVVPLVESLSEATSLVAVTNAPESLLAHRANAVLPMCAGAETTVATKTYLNSLAVLWLLVRRWAGMLDGNEYTLLGRVADEVEHLLADAETTVAHWLETLAEAQHLWFMGHGPHAATARQAAMMVNEWAKVPALNASIGAFRHGFIESSGAKLGVVVFAAPGRTCASACALADELRSYGARVLLVGNGQTRHVNERETTTPIWDEFLSPLLDIIPAQLFAEALARHLGIAPGFRYISKVVTSL